MSDLNIKKYTKKDFTSNQMVKWCPGCGDFSILNSLLGVFPKTGKKPHEIAVVSGIGCSSRFPYYVNTYGFHGIHGRGAALATGVKLANPELSVWQITGDGDGLAIGGNHTIHVIRRNIDINILLFNNRIYGLTKGQYSPTSQKGQITKTSPDGVLDNPFNPGELVLGAMGHFFARALDVNAKSMQDTFLAAEQHRGTSFVEVLQNCVIFNDGAFSDITDKENKDDRQLFIEDGKPMLFGKDNEKGIHLNLEKMKLEVVTVGENGITIDDILVHDAKMEDIWLHNMLVRIGIKGDKNFPVVFGIIRDVDYPTYDDELYEQIEDRQNHSPYKSVEEMLFSGDIFDVN